MADSEVLFLPRLLESERATRDWDESEWTSPESPLNVLFAIHTSADPHTAVYNNTRERAAFLESCGHRCTNVSPESFPWVHRFSHRLIPLLFPIALARYIAKSDFDVAIFHSHAGWPVSLLRRLVRKFRNLRTAIIFHGLEPLYFSRLQQEVPLSLRFRLMHGHLMRALLKLSCRRADHVWCLNSDEQHYLVLNEWVRRERVSVSSNPTPEEFFLSRRYAPRAKRLLFVGQWLPMKGTRYLVDAFTRLNRAHRDLQLSCVGTLADSATVLRSFPYDVRPSVVVLPRVDRNQLLEAHRHADLFVFPTLSEGSSLALAEAMAAGLPIVTTPVGAAPDVLRHHSSALFVPTRDSDALFDSVERLMNDQPLRARLGRAAQIAAERLRPEDCWQEFRTSFDRFTQASRTRKATLVSPPFSGTRELCP